MSTVFSHIVQKRLSRENENVATEALTYILSYSTEARAGIMRLLRGIVPEMPELRFQAQQTEGTDRPDMWGYDKAEARVLIENKFWAGLTENQPVSYLKRLAVCRQPTVLLMVVPEAREHTMWRELNRRLRDAEITAQQREAAPNIACSVSIEKGPVLALTSWHRLISALEREVADGSPVQGDLLQLRALCDAADTDVLISSADISDQRTPALILQLSTIVQKSVELAVTRSILNTDRLLPQANSERIGRYACFWDKQGVGIWLGIHFTLWRSHGETPLWVVFSNHDNWGCAREVSALLEPWAAERRILTATRDDEFVIAIDIVCGQETDDVVWQIVHRLEEIGSVLRGVKRKGP